MATVAVSCQPSALSSSGTPLAKVGHMRKLAAHGRPTRRRMLRLSVASVLGLAALPSIASATPITQAIATPPARDDWSVANPIGGPVWVTTISEAALRAQPDIADNRFGY